MELWFAIILSCQAQNTTKWRHFWKGMIVNCMQISARLELINMETELVRSWYNECETNTWSFISMGIRYLFLLKSLFFLEDKGPVFESFNKTFGKIEKCYNGNRSKTNHLTSLVMTSVIAYSVYLFQENFPNFSCSFFPRKLLKLMI